VQKITSLCRSNKKTTWCTGPQDAPWPYSLQAEGELSENDRVLKALSLLDEHFGQGYGIYVLDRGELRKNF